MARSGSASDPIEDRESFERALKALVMEAENRGVPYDGAFEFPTSDGVNVEITVSRLARPEGPRQVPTESAVPGEVSDLTDVPTRTSLVQVLTGLPLDYLDGTACTRCEQTLQEGDEVRTHVRKPIHEVSWEIEELYCSECAVSSIQSVEIGRSDVLVAGTVADFVDVSRQSSWNILTNVEIIEYSGPSDGR